MSASVYAVIVHAQPGAQANDVVPRLAPLLNLREETIRSMCGRGFVTIESSLSEEEGMFVLARLQAEGLPAELVKEASLLSQTPATPPITRISPATSPPADDAPITNVALFAEEDWDDMMGSLEFLDDPAVPSATIEEIVVSPPVKPLAQPSASAGWGALFPDLEAARDPVPTALRAPSPRPASVPAPSAPVMSFGAEPVASPESDFVAQGLVPHSSMPEGPPLISSPVASSPPPQPMSAPRQPGAFQGGQLLQALGMDREEQPPYPPEGYDPRPPHSPVIARWLSILAPGAGQVYNGEERLSLDYGLRFFLVMPWVKGVKQAERRAKKIATYWAPRPPLNHMTRTLKYIGAWYLSVLSVLGVCVIAGVLIHDQLTHSNVAPANPATVAQSVKEARLDVQQARIAGLDAMSDMMEEIQVSRSQMSKEERIKRLFIRGFEDCQRGHFPSCEETMRRVSELAEGNHRDAFRLQAWAAMRRGGGQPVPMPKVDSSVRSLAEYEMLEHDRVTQKDLEEAPLEDPPEDDPIEEPPSEAPADDEAP